MNWSHALALCTIEYLWFGAEGRGWGSGMGEWERG